MPLFSIPISIPTFRFAAILVCLATGLCSTSTAQHQPAPAAATQQKKPAASDPQRLYAASVQALQEGNLPKARTGFESLVKRNPKSAEYRDLLGYVLMLQAEPR